MTGDPRVGVIVNPASAGGGGERSGRRTLAEFAARRVETIDLSAADARQALANARAAIAAGVIDLLVVVGGDGTVHLGVNAVAGTSTPLGIVATGTGNDNARELGLAIGNPARAIDQLLHGTEAAIDAVRIDRPTMEPHWFLGILSTGFDALVAERASRWRWPRGKLRYNLATVRELGSFRALRYRIDVDGVSTELDAMMVSVANAPAYGGGMKLVPGADLTDGVLEVFIIHQVSIMQLIRVFPRVYSGAHLSHPAIEIIRGAAVRVDTPGVVAYADGERIDLMPLSCTVVPGALRILR